MIRLAKIALCLTALAVSAPARAATSLVASWGTIATANSSSVQRKLFFDGTRWWAFYLKSTDRTRLYYAYSTDLAAWTETSVSINNGVATEGGAETVDVLWDAATSQVLVSYQGYTTYRGYGYIRGSLSGTTISWGVNTLFIDNTGGGKAAGGDWQFSWAKGSDGKILAWHANSGGNFIAGKSTNVLSSVFADTGANWSTTSVAGTVGYPKKDAAYALASGKFTALGVDGYNVKAHVFNGTSWTNYQALALVSGDYYSWGSAFISDTSIWVLARTATSTLSLYQATTGGATWGAKTAPAWPTSGLATNSQVALATDGTDLWAVVIRGDANKTVSYNKYSVAGNSWGGWTDLEAGAATRQYVAATIANSTLVATWGQVNGANYDLYNATLSLASGGASATLAAQTALGTLAAVSSTGTAASTISAQTVLGTLAAVSATGTAATVDGLATLAAQAAVGDLAAVSTTGAAVKTIVAQTALGTLASMSSTGTATRTLSALTSLGTLAAVSATGTAARTISAQTALGTLAAVSAAGAAAATLAAQAATGNLAALSSTGTAAAALAAQAATGALAAVSASSASDGLASLAVQTATGTLAALSSTGTATGALAALTGTGALVALSAAGDALAALRAATMEAITDAVHASATRNALVILTPAVTGGSAICPTSSHGGTLRDGGTLR